MQRNKYIYCLSDAAVVVHSSRNKGGTWHGAVESLKNEWTPLWVRRTADGAAGNAELAVKAGEKWLPEHIEDVDVGKLFADRGSDGPVQPQMRPDRVSGARPPASPSQTDELPLGDDQQAADAKGAGNGRGRETVGRIRPRRTP